MASETQTELSKESVQARAMFEVEACQTHIDCDPCPSGMCQEVQGEMSHRALCYAHHCHRCASLLCDAGSEAPSVTPPGEPINRGVPVAHTPLGSNESHW